MESIFKKAERKQVKLKLALTGPSGSGKTYSALKIAKGLTPNGRIALIDTENSSAQLYSDVPGIPGFDTVDLKPPFESDRYIQLINAAVKAEYDVLIIDSISQQWNGEGGILDRKDRQSAKPGTNSWAIWAQFTPECERFKQAILQAPIHVITTMRSKHEYIVEQNEKGKQAPRKVGTAPIQRDGVEYEYTIVLDMDVGHYATASKDRTGLFRGIGFIPDETTGSKIMEWMITGAEDTKPWRVELAKVLKNTGIPAEDLKAITGEMFPGRTSKDLNCEEIKSLINKVTAKKESVLEGLVNCVFE